MMAFFYLTVSSGMVVNVHYCMGKFSSVSFGHEQDHNDGACDKCGMAKTENHCCKDEVTKVKLSDSHQFSSFAFELAGISAVLPEKIIVMSDPEQGVSPVPLNAYTSPPPNTHNKVYLAVQTFLI